MTWEGEKTIWEVEVVGGAVTPEGNKEFEAVMEGDTMGAQILKNLGNDPFHHPSWIAALEIASREGVSIFARRVAFERYLVVYPTAVSSWLQYLEVEKKGEFYGELESLYDRCLTLLPHVDVWMHYLGYLENVKRVPKGVIVEAYKTAKDYLGTDLFSEPVWTGLLRLYEEVSEPAKIHETYKILLTCPIRGIKDLYRKYRNWGRLDNSELTDSHLKSIKDRHELALSVLDRREAAWVQIDRRMTPQPPDCCRPAELDQVTFWDRAIKFEASNPMGLEELFLRGEVRRTLNLALVYMRQFPDMWHRAAQMQLNLDDDLEEALNFYRRGTEAIPSSQILAFSLADLLESNQRAGDAVAEYRRLLKDHPSALAYIQYMRFARRNLGAKAARCVFLDGARFVEERRETLKRGSRENPEDTHLGAVFSAAAEMEYYTNGSRGMASRVFQKGIQLFSEDPEFCCAYLEFLRVVNDPKATGFEEECRERFESHIMRDIIDKVSGDTAFSSRLFPAPGSKGWSLPLPTAMAVAAPSEIQTKIAEFTAGNEDEEMNGGEAGTVGEEGWKSVSLASFIESLRYRAALPCGISTLSTYVDMEMDEDRQIPVVPAANVALIQAERRKRLGGPEAQKKVTGDKETGLWLPDTSSLVAMADIPAISAVPARVAAEPLAKRAPVLHYLICALPTESVFPSGRAPAIDTKKLIASLQAIGN